MIETSIDVIGGKSLRFKMSQIDVKLPNALNKDAEEILKLYRKALRRGLDRVGIRSRTGRLRAFRTTKEGKNDYIIEMPQYGHFLDLAKQHAIPLFEPNKAKGPYTGNIKYAINWANATGYSEKFLNVEGKKWLGSAIRDGRRTMEEYLPNGYTLKFIRGK